VLTVFFKRKEAKPILQATVGAEQTSSKGAAGHSKQH
jgi:hypothetical protein